MSFDFPFQLKIVEFGSKLQVQAVKMNLRASLKDFLGYFLEWIGTFLLLPRDSDFKWFFFSLCIGLKHLKQFPFWNHYGGIYERFSFFYIFLNILLFYRHFCILSRLQCLKWNICVALSLYLFFGLSLCVSLSLSLSLLFFHFLSVVFLLFSHTFFSSFFIFFSSLVICSLFSLTFFSHLKISNKNAPNFTFHS